jgi:transcriptional regulator with XRE-family HTH domain
MQRQDTLRAEFAQLLRTDRTAKGWSRSRLARALGVTEASIENWERGGLPNYESNLNLCVVFDWPHPLLSK